MKKANAYGLILLLPVAMIRGAYLWIWSFDRLATAMEFESFLTLILVWLVV